MLTLEIFKRSQIKSIKSKLSKIQPGFFGIRIIIVISDFLPIPGIKNFCYDGISHQKFTPTFHEQLIRLYHQIKNSGFQRYYW